MDECGTPSEATEQYLLVDVFTAVNVGQALLYKWTSFIHFGHEQKLGNVYRRESNWSD